MNDSQETETSLEPSIRAKRFYDNPVFSFSSFIVGVIGIILFIASTKSPDLVYYVDSARTTVVRVNQSSRLRVEVDGKVVKKNITAAHIVIWNDGEEPIRKENLLSPFFIKTGPLNPIIEANIQKETREVLGLRLDKSKISEGLLGVNWTILEQNDGAIIQLVYYGDDQTFITASATVEGQGDIRELKFHEGLALMVGLLLVLLVLLVSFIKDSLLRGRINKRLYRIILWVQFVLTTLTTTVFIYYWGWASPDPPFNGNRSLHITINRPIHNPR
ncbi:MAG: hypothetical protein OXM01_13890 [Gemmatimonadota bacterium]|nr:hypothetical protein [Gemmatimonadota bacterium]